MRHLLALGLCCWMFSCSTQRYKIVYNVGFDLENDDYEIFVMNLDGSEKKNISNNPAVDWAYYAYEDKIYFLSDRDTLDRHFFLYEMDANGNHVRKVAPFRLEDSWFSSRKQGREFVVTRRDGDRRHVLSLIDREGNLIQDLTSDTAGYYNDPNFSPDGTQIVFRYRQNKRDRTEKEELWIMNADGSARRQLTHYPESDTSAPWHAYHAGPPYWEPHRNVISFASFQNGEYDIYSIKPDGSGLTKITEPGFNELYHVWSADGSMIVTDGFDLKKEKFSIFIMRADGSDKKQLTHEYAYEQGPILVEVSD